LKEPSIYFDNGGIGRYFWSYNSGLQNQDVYFSQKDLQGPNTTLLDPNTLSKDGTVAVMESEITRDGTLMAYQVGRYQSSAVRRRK
jgi:Prolyl oligopeptidase, N-terminal beta-propeller domain